MEWINENWIILLFVGGMMAMHLFGHGHGKGKGKGKGKGGGCCGGGGHKHGNDGGSEKETAAKKITNS